MIFLSKKTKLVFKTILSLKLVRIILIRLTLLIPWRSNCLILIILYLAQASAYAGNRPLLKKLVAKLSSLNPDYASFIRLSSILTEGGFHDDGVKILKARSVEGLLRLRESQLDRLGIRVFSEKWFSPIGHSGLIDVFIKAEKLGIIEKKTNLIVGEDSSFANPALIDLWQSYVSRIKNLNQSKEFTELVTQCEERLQFIEKKNGVVISLYALCTYVQLNWEKESRGPLLSLSPKNLQDGYQVLEKLGTPKGAWFCGLHNRSVANNSPSVRNADLISYELAIKAITAKGGYVVYLGDQAPPLDWSSRYHFVNYSESELRSDWMDVFILAEGRFLIGLGSGPGDIPMCFGKPSLLTNWGPMGARHRSRDDILLPKQYRLKSESRFLTMSERMSSRFGHQDSLQSLAFMGIDVIDNSPEEIADVVVEMMNRLSKSMNSPLSAFEIAAQEKFSNESLNLDLYPVKLARNFIERYPECFK